MHSPYTITATPFPLPPPPPPETLSISHFTPTMTMSTSRNRKKRTKQLHQETKPTSRKRDPLAPKITRPCTECGKTFWSWKALFGHMRCHPEREWRGINPPPHLRREPPLLLPAPLKSPPPSDNDLEVAASLLLLAASAKTDIAEVGTVTTRFECSSCKKVFSTHQALGGHRASHKNVKGCFAITKGGGVEDEGVNGINAVEEGRNCNFGVEEEKGIGLDLFLGLGHRCGVCFKVFTSGPALGGHMRCHIGPGVGVGLVPVSQVVEAQYSHDLNASAEVVDDVAPMELDLRLGI